MPFLPAAVAGLSALYKLGHGIAQGEDAKFRKARNRQPMYDIEQEYFDNQSIAENFAGQGFTSTSVDNFNTQNERGLQSSIDAMLQGGGGPNSITAAYSSYLLGNRNFAAADAEKQVANIKELYARNLDLAGQKTQQWAINEYKPYADENAAIAAQANAASQNINTAFGEATAIASSLATANSNDKLFERGTPTTPATPAGQSSPTPAIGTQPVLQNQFADYYNFIQEQEQGKTASEELEKLTEGLTPAQISQLLAQLGKGKI